MRCRQDRRDFSNASDSGEGFNLNPRLRGARLKEKPAALLRPCFIHAAGSVSMQRFQGDSMTDTIKAKKIRAVIGVDKMPDGDFVPLLHRSLNGLTTNPTVYSKPPVDLTRYAAGISDYEGSIPVALDGGKTALAQKKKLRLTVTKMYRELAHYVEANCDEDMATFLLSGFQASSTAKTPSQPLAQPKIVSVTQGPVTGQLKVKIAAVPNAASYDLRRGSVPPGGGVPATWTEQGITSTKALIVDSLTPGTTYMFQVRALGSLGHTDWSDPVTRMVI
jgi:hypothetical protein